MKYFNGKALGEKIFLYRRVANLFAEDIITPNKVQYYFCVLTADVDSHQEFFQSLVDRKLVIRYDHDDNPKYVRVYCRNANIYEPSPENTDEKNSILEELKEQRIEAFEADLSSLDRYMIDNADTIEIEDKYQVAYFDIETKDTEDGIVIGREPILSIAIVDSEGNKFAFCSTDEARMIKEALDKLSEYQLIYGWYSKKFDWDYIKARCGFHGIRFNLWHVNHVDMMEWFEKAKFTGAIKEKIDSYSLNNVSNQFLGIGKTEGVGRGHGAIWNLFRTDKKKLIEYNINDCDLLRQLDSKLHISEQIIQQCLITGTFISKKSHTTLTDNYLLRLARSRGIRLPSRIRNRPPKYVSPPGGRVFVRKPGVYKWVLGFDFASMYNTIMQSFNIGPDTVVTLDQLKKENAVKEPLILSPYTYLVNQVIKWIEEEAVADGLTPKLTVDGIAGNPITYCRKLVFPKGTIDGVKLREYATRVYTTKLDKFTIKPEAFFDYFMKVRKAKDGSIVVENPMPTFFRKKFTSIVVEALKTYTANRNQYKKKRAQLIADGVNEKDTEFIYTEIMVSVFKLLGNIIYGQCGFRPSRIYKEQVPPSITLACQLIANLTARWFTDHGCTVLYIDTDSNYLTFEGDFSKEKLKKLRQDFESEYPDYLKSKLIKMFNIDEKNYVIELEFEKIWDSVAFFMKKRYAGHLVWETGKGKQDKIDIKGLEFKRRETISFAADLQEELLNKILRSKKVPIGEEYFNWFRQIKKDFIETEWNEETILKVAKRNVISKRPDQYKSKQTHIRLLERMLERGDVFEYGSILQYVLINVTTNDKNEAEEVSEFIRRRKEFHGNNELFDEYPPELSLNIRHYWDTEIYAKCTRILRRIFPGEPWYSLTEEIYDKSKKRYEQLVKRINGKISEREKTLGMIIDYKTFDPDQRIGLLNLFIEKQLADFGTKDALIPKAQHVIDNIHDYLYHNDEKDDDEK